MLANNSDAVPAQPISASVNRILMGCIVNADSKADAKVMACTAYETGALTAAETFALLVEMGLASE